MTKCSAESLSVTADANNHLQGGYTYDSAGNMLHDATANLNYSYDQENRITGAAGYTYTYDGDGNRVEKSSGSTGTLYWYMSPGIVAESDLVGNLTSEYVFFDGERVARKDFPGLAVSYYFSDHLKTTDIVTDASGNIKNESDFYPWGGELEFLANDSNHYKFTGKERDTETGLDYFGARYYSNGLGRFITPDWAAKAAAVPYAEFADPQSLNLYSYVRNVPTARVDLDGHDNRLGELLFGTDDAVQAAKNVGNGLLKFAVNTIGLLERAVGHGIESDAPRSLLAPNNQGEYTGMNLPAVVPALAEEEEVGSTVNRIAGEVEAVEEIPTAVRTTAAMEEEPHPSVTTPYERPSGATTPEQRAAVQGKPCVDCGKVESKMIANHKDPLVKEYYETGKIDAAKMRSLDSVNSHCPTCSAQSGGRLSHYSKRMKAKLRARQK